MSDVKGNSSKKYCISLESYWPTKRYAEYSYIGFYNNILPLLNYSLVNSVSIDKLQWITV